MISTRFSGGCCLHMCNDSLFEKINVLHWNDRGNLLWGKCSTWLVVSRRWIILSILGSTCYHDRMQLSPFTRHHQYITGLQQHYRALQGSPLMAGEAQVLQHCSATLTLQRHMIQSRSRPDLLSLWELGRPSWAGVAVSDVYRHHCSWLFLPEVQKPGVSLLNPKGAAFSKLRNSLLWADFQEHS